MLRTLRIQNFALIDRVDLDLQGGFTVITGETGSGKSILLSALNLILGERADFSVIGPSSDKAVVEAIFNINSFGLETFFTENDLDFDKETVIRREISASGKSRAFINDTPVGLPILKSLTEKLINIHSQYNTLELKSKNYQLEVLDLLADLKEKRLLFSEKYAVFQKKHTQLNELKHTLANLMQKQDYNSFQLHELEDLSLESKDYAVLEADLKKAENSGDLLQALQSVVSVIENEDQVSDKLRSLKISLDRLKGVDASLDELTERIKSLMIELSDISNDASRLVDSIEIDPEKIQFLSDLLNKYNHALKKHNVIDQSQLIALRDKLEKEVLNVEEVQNLILGLEDEVSALEKDLSISAEDLHFKRLASVGHVSNNITAILDELKLPNTKLEFNLIKRDSFNQFGITDVAMMFSANLGIETVPIEKAASGGELSRVMLALQKLISEKSQLPTVLFDEIDTGVSGDVAQKIGSLLNKMGQHFQLIAISHLPQVAAKANHHLRVEKELVDDRTSTRVKVLGHNERIEEIARLMSGELITDAAIENARALMN